MDANAITSFPLGRSNNDFGEVRATNVNTTERFVGGAKGELGAGWSWDAYYQYGRNTFDSELDNHRIEQNFQYSLDAIIDGGQAVCRDPAARAAGCVPINLFGLGAPSQEAIDYVTGTPQQRATTKLDVAGVSLRGEPFSLPAGDVSIAVGLEARKEQTDQRIGELDAAKAFKTFSFSAMSGEFSVKEAFAAP